MGSTLSWRRASAWLWPPSAGSGGAGLPRGQPYRERDAEQRATCCGTAGSRSPRGLEWDVLPPGRARSRVADATATGRDAGSDPAVGCRQRRALRGRLWGSLRRVASHSTGGSRMARTGCFRPALIWFSLAGRAVVGSDGRGVAPRRGDGSGTGRGASSAVGRVRAVAPVVVLAVVLVGLTGACGAGPRPAEGAAGPTAQVPGTRTTLAGQPSPSSSSAPRTARPLRSAPAGGPVPAGFRAWSVTFVSDREAYLLGDAPCRRPPCTSVVRTLDGGR